MASSICPDASLDELAGEMLARLDGRRYPFTGSFELTERCNLRCIHCYINRPAGSRSAGSRAARELSTTEVAGILDQVADAGCLSLLLTGGEILLRADFPQILRHAARKGFLLTLFTNGTLLTPRLADLLAEWPPRRLEITIYGATEGTHERVTRVAGSYVRCLRGIELALQRRLPLGLKAVVLAANRHELRGMREFAGRLGVDFRYDGLLWPRIDGGRGPLAQRLSPRQVAALDEEDPERGLEWQRLLARAPGQVRGDRVYHCSAGRHGFHIDCRGRLSACIMARRPAFDLLGGSFREAWEEGLGRVIEERRRLDTACRTCRVGALCTQCPGWSQLVHGDNETPVAYVCELAHERAARYRPSASCLTSQGYRIHGR